MTETTNTTPMRGEEPRRPSRLRVGSVLARAAHLVAATAVAGACLLGRPAAAGHAWWIAAALTGAVLLVIEILRHPGLLREMAGGATILKLALAGAALALPGAAAPLMSAAIVVAVLGAHLPRGWRHRRIL